MRVCAAVAVLVCLRGGRGRGRGRRRQRVYEDNEDTAVAQAPAKEAAPPSAEQVMLRERIARA